MGPRKLQTRLVLVGVAVLTAVVFLAVSSAWNAALRSGQFSPYVSPGVVAGVLVLGLLRLLERHNRDTFGARFRECASVVSLGIAPGLAVATWGHNALMEAALETDGRARLTAAIGIVGLAIAMRHAIWLAEDGGKVVVRLRWYTALGACAVAACLAGVASMTDLDERAMPRTAMPIGELPPAPKVAAVPSDQRVTTSLGGLRLTRGADCSLYVEAPNQCSRLEPFAAASPTTCGAVRVYEDSVGWWWLDVDGNAPKIVTPNGAVHMRPRRTAEKRNNLTRASGALLGVLIAAWSLVGAKRARRRARQIAAGVDATHRGRGWIAPEDDRPPVHVPAAAADEPGPVVLTSAPSSPRSYREGGSSPANVEHLPGTREERLSRARDEERGNLAYALTAVVLLTTPLVCALLRDLLP